MGMCAFSLYRLRSIHDSLIAKLVLKMKLPTLVPYSTPKIICPSVGHIKHKCWEVWRALLPTKYHLDLYKSRLTIIKFYSAWRRGYRSDISEIWPKEAYVGANCVRPHAIGVPPRGDRANTVRPYRRLPIIYYICWHWVWPVIRRVPPFTGHT